MLTSNLYNDNYSYLSLTTRKEIVREMRTVYQSENIHPAKGDMTIMRTEKQNELTDMSVALCSGGTIWFKAMSDLIWIRSSANAVRNPPRVIRYHMPVNSLTRPIRASDRQKTNNLPNVVFFTFLAARAPTIPPIDIMKSRGPNAQSGIPVIGSFA